MYLKHGKGTLWEKDMPAAKYLEQRISTSSEYNTPINKEELPQTWIYDGEFSNDLANGQGLKAWVDHPEYDQY